jgi:RNA polymerase sigma-70 factor (ECF subfamily)
MTPPLDLACLERAKAGDPQAFRAVYEHCAELVHRFLLRMLGEPAAAEDALQETFMRVLRGLRSFDPAGPARLTTWVLTIARRVALSRALAEARARRRDDVAREAQPRVLAFDEEAAELRRALGEAVASLPIAQRSVFVLRESHALSYEEIAAIEETDVGTVKSRLHRARVALQEQLKVHLDRRGGSETALIGRSRERHAKA